ncbi:MAG: ABC transporter ATP-binding protein [Bacteroidales bacterium]|nr:ABC transporter ATP-binding protein [Bacteroidales bacterium]
MLLKTIDISKTFKNHEMATEALSMVNIQLAEGEFVAVMGPSGCGKSTLLNILGLLDSPTSGEYFFKGVKTNNLSEKKRTLLRKENMGFVFQSFNLIDDLTVYENVELPLLYMKMGSKERKFRVLNALEKLQMMHCKKFYPQQLSGGQQQRVAVARAVITNPKLLLADEPTGNLDSVNGEEVMSILTELNQGGTSIIMVTHSPSYAERAGRIIHLFDGHIVTENIKSKLVC